MGLALAVIMMDDVIGHLSTMEHEIRCAKADLAIALREIRELEAK